MIYILFLITTFMYLFATFRFIRAEQGKQIAVITIPK